MKLLLHAEKKDSLLRPDSPAPNDLDRALVEVAEPVGGPLVSVGVGLAG